MLPFSAIRDSENMAWSYSELHGEGLIGNAARRSLPDFINVSLGQSCIVVPFAARQGRAWAASCLTAFADFIGSVDGGCAEEEVLRSDAGRIVAVVADEHPIRYWPKMQLPREAMCLNNFSVDLEPSISETVVRPFEDPASRSLLHVPPETFLRKSVASGVGTSAAAKARSSGSKVRRIWMILRSAVQARRSNHASKLTQVALARQGLVA